jgi:deoxyribonuclease V
MLACLDVHYEQTFANASAVGFAHWDDAAPAIERVVRVGDVQPYEPGQFYKRELPCLLAVLQTLPTLTTVIIDGFVWLDGPGKPGLGAHLFRALGENVPVIGVAKTRFKGAHNVVEITRGTSQRPLIVSAVGVPLAEAAEHVRTMEGEYRIPTLLARVDRLCRAG